MKKITIKKLNLGCGKKIKQGYINLDNKFFRGVDVIHDLDKYPYPFKDDYFDYVLCDNVLEHLDNLIKTMEELHRITKKNGTIEIIVPYFSSIGAFQDPTHRHFFTLKTFDYFTENFDYNFYTPARFKIEEKKLIFLKRLKVFEWLFNKYQNIYEVLGIPYLIPASGIKLKLRVTK